MGLSKLEIANQALARVGATKITDLSDTNNSNAVTVSTYLDFTLEQIEQVHYWNFLMRRVKLDPVQDNNGDNIVPAFEWEYAFELPSDFLRAYKVNGKDNTPWGVDIKYEIGLGPKTVEGDGAWTEPTKPWIFTNSEECKLEYVSKRSDTENFDLLFLKALVVLLASEIAVPIRQDEGLANKLLKEYWQVALPQARRIDAGQQKRYRTNITKDSQWLKARRFSTNG